jgi:hypothetical protein
VIDAGLNTNQLVRERASMRTPAPLPPPIVEAPFQMKPYRPDYDDKRCHRCAEECTFTDTLSRQRTVNLHSSDNGVEVVRKTDRPSYGRPREDD